VHHQLYKGAPLLLYIIRGNDLEDDIVAFATDSIGCSKRVLMIAKTLKLYLADTCAKSFCPVAFTRLMADASGGVVLVTTATKGGRDQAAMTTRAYKKMISCTH
jgi:hypothetical protein